jgi:hypothetical protein
MYFLKNINQQKIEFINTRCLLINDRSIIAIFVFHLYIRINKSLYGCKIFTKDKRRIII